MIQGSDLRQRPAPNSGKVSDSSTHAKDDIQLPEIRKRRLSLTWDYFGVRVSELVLYLA